MPTNKMKLFLSSYFAKVAPLLPDFLDEDCTEKTIAFIPTASNVEKVTFYIGADKKALKKLGLNIIDIDIAKAPTATTASVLEKCDYIFVEGGNTFYLLQELKRTGAHKLIQKHIRSGKPYIGASAGSMILSPDISYAQGMDNPKLAPTLDNFVALNIVDFYPLPHVNNFPFKQSAKNILEKYGKKIQLCPIDNSQVIIVDGQSQPHIKTIS